MTVFDLIKLFPENIKSKIIEYGVEDEQTRQELVKEDIEDCFKVSEIKNLNPSLKKLLWIFFNNFIDKNTFLNRFSKKIFNGVYCSKILNNFLQEKKRMIKFPEIVIENENGIDENIFEFENEMVSINYIKILEKFGNFKLDSINQKEFSVFKSYKEEKLKEIKKNNSSKYYEKKKNIC